MSPKNNSCTFVLWFTGLSGAGKSTLADKTYQYLLDKGLKVERLDGDVVRKTFPKIGFTKEARDKHIRRIGLLASSLEKNGAVVVASFISPYKGAREFVREKCSRFYEIYVEAALETCELRDPKGLYKKARAGKIKQFTGIDDPYEKPVNPEIVINTDQDSAEQSFEKLKEKIDRLSQ